MIGFEDEAMQAAIERVWMLVCNVDTEWRRLFRRTGDDESSPNTYVLSNDRIESFRKALTGDGRSSLPPEKYIAFGLAELRKPQRASHPGIFTRYQSGQLVFPAGMAGGGDDEEEGVVTNNATIEIVCLADQKDVATALANFVLSAVFTSLHVFMESFGADQGAIPVSMSEISPMRDLLPERGSAFWWRMPIKIPTEAELVYFDTTRLAALQPSIHDDSVTDDGAGNPGKVHHN